MPPYDTLPPYQFSPTGDAQQLSILWAYDSVYAPVNHAEPVPRKSLFTHHLLPVQHPYEIALSHNAASGWYLGGIALSILLLCLFLRRKQLKMLDLLQSLVNARTMARVLREANLTRSSEQALIAPLMLLPMCLVLNAVLSQHSFSVIPFLTVFLCACVVYYLRNGLLRFLGNAFLNTAAVHIYLSSNYLYHLAYGISVTALSFFICFTGSLGIYFFYFVAGWVGILYVMRLVRGMHLILSNAKTPKIFLFYYLCTLEIVPAIVLIYVAIS